MVFIICFGVFFLLKEIIMKKIKYLVFELKCFSVLENIYRFVCEILFFIVYISIIVIYYLKYFFV